MWETFFLSSRRRHTRLVSDWSSHVCSSDLGVESFIILSAHGHDPQGGERLLVRIVAVGGEDDEAFDTGFLPGSEQIVHPARSEERRVGKERRDRWSPKATDELTGYEGARLP